MSSSVIGMFDSASEISSLKSDLQSLGIGEDQIQVHRDSQLTTGSPVGATSSKGFWEELKEMFGGESSHHADYYAEGTRRGSTLVTVNSPDQLTDQVADLMRQHNAVNIDDRAAEWSRSGWTGYQAPDVATAGSTTGAKNWSTGGIADTADTTMPVVENVATPSTSMAAASTASGVSQQTPVALQEAEEQLAVGKRQVLRGGVRVVRRVTETPVEESVRLREEKVSVDRRPVDRPLTAAEAETAFTDRTVELTEVGEEAVAAKSAHVVGEVVVDKTAAERVETVRDTVRRSDVQVERLPGQDAATEIGSKTSDTMDAPVRSTAKTTP